MTGEEIGVDPIRVIMGLMEDEVNPTGPMLTLSVGPYSMYTIISALQLACRHPELHAELKQQMRELGQHLAGSFTGDARRLVEAGWDRRLDR